MPDADLPTARLASLRAEADTLAAQHPDRVSDAAAACRADARQDHLDGTPRGRAMVRRLRDLTVEQPALGLAVARSLQLEHIVEDLLAGTSVDGVTGIGADGTVLPPSRSDLRRRRGVVLLLAGGVVLLAGATAADSLSLVLVVLWTAASFALIFGGLRDVLHRG